MYLVEADSYKRLITITAAGQVSVDEVQAAVAQVRDLIEHFEPGFCALTDFRFLERMEPTAATHVAAIMDALAAKKVACVRRIIPDPHKDFGLNILSHFHYGPEISIMTYDRMVDAIAAMLAQE